jgi:hypothetical protein
MANASQAPQASSGLRVIAILGMLLVSLCVAAPVHAQSVLLDEVHTIAAATSAVPIEHSFNVTTAGTYAVQLTDLGKAANPNGALASVKLAITSGNTIVGKPLSSEGTTQFTATPGAYVVRVIGVPGDLASGSGPFGVHITNMADNSVLADGSFSDTLALAAAAAPNVTVVDDSFTVTANDTYQVALSDQQFPQALNLVQLALTAQGSSSAPTTLSIINGVPASAGATVALQANTTYRIFTFGQAASSANAGLYSVVVRDSHGTVVYGKTLAVGGVQSLGSVTLAAATYNLNYTDLQFPAALAATGNGAMVLLDDHIQAVLTATGSRAINATGGTYQVFATATAAATPGAGSYDVELQPSSGPAALSVAQAVTLTGSALQAYVFSADIATAGNYAVQLADFKFPSAFISVSMAAVQSGASLATPLTTAGTLNIAAATGKLWMIGFGQAPTGGSVLGLFVTPAAGGSTIFGTTQAIGGIFSSRKVTVSSAGSYEVNVTDVGFPANFATLYVLVTQGPTLVGSIFGGGSFPFTAAAGDYFITFIAQPAAPDNAGTYAINIAPPPPAPVVTFSSSVSHVASGGSANLMWSSKNATSCTASGGWSGVQPLSGSASTGALTADTKFTLSCTGISGTTSQSVTITIDHSSGGGGGGALDLTSLAVLAGLLAARLRPRLPKPQDGSRPPARRPSRIV